MDLILNNKGDESRLASVTITLNDKENITKFTEEDGQEQQLDTRVFLTHLQDFGFRHPLLEEPVTQPKGSKLKFTYGSINELFLLPVRIVAAFVNFAPQLKEISVSPTADYKYQKKRPYIEYAPHANARKNQQLEVETFEALIQKISKQKDYAYYNDFIFKQTVSITDLNESLDVDLLYTGDEEEFLQSLQTEEPIAIRYVSASVGHGAFASRDLKKGECIGLYSGEVLVKPRSSIFVMWLGNVVFPMRVDAAKKGNLTRFINHADKEPQLKKDPFIPTKDVTKDILLPNCSYRGYSLFGMKFVTVNVTRDVKKNEQLLVYYGNDYWGKRDNKYFLTKKNRVVSEQSKEKAWIQAPKREDYLWMIQYGVKRVRGLLLFRPIIGLTLSVVIIASLNYFF